MENYSISIPCKNYIRKYFTAQYGAPIPLALDTNFGDTILTKLSAKPLKRPTQNFLNLAFRDFDSEIKFLIPIHFFYRLQNNVTSQHVWCINRFLQKTFEEDLFIITNIAACFGVARRKAHEAWAQHYNIILDEDMTRDALKKSEQRTRAQKTTENNFLAILSRNPTASIRWE